MDTAALLSFRTQPPELMINCADTAVVGAAKSLCELDRLCWSAFRCPKPQKASRAWHARCPALGTTTPERSVRAQHGMKCLCNGKQTPLALRATNQLQPDG